jgi:hypothetical protein
MDTQPVFRACAMAFGPTEVALIGRLIEEAQPRNRAEVARRVCAALGWTDALGRPKLMSCRVALLRLHRAGLIELPAPTGGNGNGKALSREVAMPQERALVGSVEQLGDIELEWVRGRQRSALWNRLIERYHYLGYTPLPGAQIRYLVHSAHGVLGAIGFGAAAWKVAPRDRWIGWEVAARERGLGQVLNNARFLIVPWVQVHNLASKVLSVAARRVREDFAGAYGIEPVLLETFVEVGRFAGTCYRAANWVEVGHTKGRGKLDRYKRAALPVKAVYLYPLRRDFRQVLCA